MSTRPSSIASRSAAVKTPTPISAIGALVAVALGRDDHELGRRARRPAKRL